MINIVNTARAYSEVYEFINSLGNEYKDKLPKRIYLTIQDNRDKNYIPKYEVNQSIDSNTFSKEALALISALNLQYWCEDAEEKERLKKVYTENQKLENEKYSYENLFKNNKTEEQIQEEQQSENVQMIEYKEENVFQKVFNKIREFLTKYKKRK